jgi:hypothetical protein
MSSEARKKRPITFADIALLQEEKAAAKQHQAVEIPTPADEKSRLMDGYKSRCGIQPTGIGSGQTLTFR